MPEERDGSSDQSAACISGPVWEEESFDHVLRSDESLKEKCEYIWQNAVKAGLVKNPESYRWVWVNPELAP